jgi:histidyl-tRNA synthetase
MWTKRSLVKLYYIGPQFRRERPQKGRFRQFYQIGAEVIGNTDNPAIEAEVIEMLDWFLKELGITNSTLLINSVGCPNCRPNFNETLKRELAANIDKMCSDCQRRYEVNPLRVLDCKVPADQPYIDALPSMLDMLCGECKEHFEKFRSYLDARRIAYTISKRMVRGLDYYVKTAFEIIGGNLGAQNSILGGGRYDGLSETLGGPPSRGFGFAIGFDRLVMSLPEDSPIEPPRPDYFIAWLGDEALDRAVLLARDLRNVGLNIAIDFETRKLKGAMREADKLGVRRVIIIGEDELRSGKYIVRDMADGSQTIVDANDAVSILK